MPSAERTPNDWMVTGPSSRLGNVNQGMSARGSDIGASVYSPAGGITTAKRAGAPPRDRDPTPTSTPTATSTSTSTSPPDPDPDPDLDPDRDLDLDRDRDPRP